MTRIERVFPIRLDVLPKANLPAGEVKEQLSSSQALKPTVHVQDRSPIFPPFTKAAPDDHAPKVFAPREITDTSKSFAVGKENHRLITQRFTYQSDDPPASQHNSTEAPVLIRCEDEPIRIPGAVQRFGALVAVREERSGRFTVSIASENSLEITGHTPEELFSLACWTDLFTSKDKADFTTRVAVLKTEPHKENSRTNLEVFRASLTSLTGTPNHLWCAMHLERNSGLIICEFEPEMDIFNPHHPPFDGFPDKPVNTINNRATPEERLLSTTSQSHELSSVRFSRKKGKELQQMDMFRALCEIQTQLTECSELRNLLDVVVGLIYELTGFHRVMVYEFDEQNCGSVVSEIIDERASEDLYRGLRFPATDIPEQARQLYLTNRTRVLYDRSQETARLVCRDLAAAKQPLDLTHSYLRAMSPIHVQYLENMGVQASMSVSLTVKARLWGLISCHSYGCAMRISLPLRELCASLGNVASTHIEKLLYADRIKARKPLSDAPVKSSPAAFIAASSLDLLAMFNADFGLLTIKGEARTVGKMLAYNEAITILQYVRMRSFTALVSSNNITRDFPDLQNEAGFTSIAGFLLIPLAFSGADFLIFFRKSQLKEIKWAGNPSEKWVVRGQDYLQPRSSFQRWTEHVIGTSREWTEDQINSATTLSTLYGRFIEIWRQKESVVPKNRMARILIRNAGHEVRTPLNSVINYLELALEQALDETARAHLEKSLLASKSLVFVVNDLLNLTNIEDEEYNIHEEQVSIRETIIQVMSAFQGEAARRKLELSFEDDSEVPSAVKCDPSKLRQVISNLLDNAFRHSRDGAIIVAVKYCSSNETTVTVEISVQDKGNGFTEQELDDLFSDFEQILDEVDDAPPDTDGSSSLAGSPPAGSRTTSVGLGLAIVARFVRQNHGQIRISSEKSVGTRIKIKIPFRVPPPTEDIKTISPGGAIILLPTPPVDVSSPVALEQQKIQIGAIATLLPNPTHPQSPLGRLGVLDGSSKTSSAGTPEKETPPTAMTGISVQSPGSERFPFPSMDPKSFPLRLDVRGKKLSILVAEDNPLNSRLLQTRLKRKGHDVEVAADGQLCVDMFKARSDKYDVVLMDIQMPNVDGIEATKQIRIFEKSTIPRPNLSDCASAYGRAPIIAVSASLASAQVDQYIDGGFDGWMLKPISFARLDLLLEAIHDTDVRGRVLFQHNVSDWEIGGWLVLHSPRSRSEEREDDDENDNLGEEADDKIR